MSHPIPKSFSDFETQYHGFHQRVVEKLENELTKPSDKKIDQKYVASVIENVFAPFKGQLEKLDQALELHHAPRVQYKATLDHENLKKSEAHQTFKKVPWGDKFDLANTINPIIQDIAKDLETQRNKQSNDLKNRLKMTPTFKNKLEAAAELVIKAKPEQRARVLPRLTMR